MNIYIKRTLLLIRSSVTIFNANKPNHFPTSLVADSVLTCQMEMDPI